MCVWSPPVNHFATSERGTYFLELLADCYDVHVFGSVEESAGCRPSSSPFIFFFSVFSFIFRMCFSFGCLFLFHFVVLFSFTFSFV